MKKPVSKLVMPSKRKSCAACGGRASAELIIGAQHQSLCCDCLTSVSSLFASALVGPFVLPSLVIPHYYDKMPKEREWLFEQARKEASQ